MYMYMGYMYIYIYTKRDTIRLPTTMIGYQLKCDAGSFGCISVYFNFNYLNDSSTDYKLSYHIQHDIIDKKHCHPATLGCKLVDIKQKIRSDLLGSDSCCKLQTEV